MAVVVVVVLVVLVDGLMCFAGIFDDLAHQLCFLSGRQSGSTVYFWQPYPSWAHLGMHGGMVWEYISASGSGRIACWSLSERLHFVLVFENTVEKRTYLTI